MPSPHLIFTVDYELFGNGTGRLEPCVFTPAKRIMSIAEKFAAPVTFFVEALEFMALDARIGDRRVKQQMTLALQHGHDVQLHIHPQWMHAKCNSKGVWTLDANRWRIGNLSYEDIYNILKSGKEWLEMAIGKDVPGYRCLAFRAGGWCIQPSKAVVRALSELGFEIDSTVVPGQWRAGKGEWSDFRNAPDRPFWKTSEGVLQVDQQGIWEVPIACGNIGSLRHFLTLLSARFRKMGGFAPGCNGSYQGPNSSKLQHWLARAAGLTQLGHVMLDVSTMPADVLIEITRQWILRFGEGESPIPLVAIAHTKNFTTASEKNMSEYLAWAKNEGIIFSTYGRWLEAIDG